jgi:hypothetical protein
MCDNTPHDFGIGGADDEQVAEQEGNVGFKIGHLACNVSSGYLADGG